MASRSTAQHPRTSDGSYTSAFQQVSFTWAHSSASDDISCSAAIRARRLGSGGRGCRVQSLPAAAAARLVWLRASPLTAPGPPGAGVAACLPAHCSRSTRRWCGCVPPAHCSRSTRRCVAADAGACSCAATQGTGGGVCAGVWVAARQGVAGGAGRAALWAGGWVGGHLRLLSACGWPGARRRASVRPSCTH